jgi:hypothetical protein
MGTLKSIHDVGELVGISRSETDSIVAEVKANAARLEQCQCHSFSVCLDRYTKQPLDNPTPLEQFGARWQCEYCGGIVQASDKRWYEWGLEHAERTT